MPMEKGQMLYERLPAISLRACKNKEIKAFQFLDEGTDIQNTPHGLTYLYRVVCEGEKSNLWIKPNGALAICLQNHVPLCGKTLQIQKEFPNDPKLRQKQTRYKVLPQK